MQRRMKTIFSWENPVYPATSSRIKRNVFRYGAPADDPLPSYGAPPAAPVYTPAPQPTYHSG